MDRRGPLALKVNQPALSCDVRVDKPGRRYFLIGFGFRRTLSRDQRRLQTKGAGSNLQREMAVREPHRQLQHPKDSISRCKNKRRGQDFQDPPIRKLEGDRETEPLKVPGTTGKDCEASVATPGQVVIRLSG